MQRTIATTRIRTPGGKEVEFYGRDPGIWAFIRANQGSKIVEVRYDLYKATEAEFMKVAHFVKTVDVKKGE